MVLGVEAAALALRRVVFLVGHATASASELLINGLAPLMEVELVGPGPTLGKPYGQDFYEHCERVIVPVTMAVANSEGVGGYDQGIFPDCIASDDFEHELGDPAEAELRTALSWLATGRCK